MHKSKRQLGYSNENLNSEGMNSRKKPKTNQSNTLLNYFQSNIAKEPKVVFKQASLDTFIKVEKIEKVVKSTIKTEEKNDSNELLELKCKHEIQTETHCLKKTAQIEIKEEKNISKNAFDLLGKSESKTKIEIKSEEVETSESGGKYQKARICPFYKRIEGTRIVVDAFSYGDIENCDAYFLSHFHYDHYSGLSKHFKHKLYCSTITANLVKKQIRVDPKYIVPLELNEFQNFYDNDDSIQVCLIDANHCPGSVMFLFRFKKTGKHVLHTGDFRASDTLINDPMLENIKIDVVHMDTTYCDSFYKFLPQSKIISLGAETVRNELKKAPNTLIICGCYTIGKERIFIAIAELLDIKICVTKEKMKIIECLNNEKLMKRVTLDPKATFLHVLPIGQLNIKDLAEYHTKFDKYDNIIAIKPTGWTHKADSEGICIEKQWKNIKIFGLEYSEHSSFEELRSFVTKVRPKRIIPHVNVAKKESRDKMQGYFNEWLQSKPV